MIDSYFELTHSGEKLTVQTKDLKGRTLFKVSFANGTIPVIITRSTDFNGQRFWTSVPEGRQEEAEQLGQLIEQYYRSKQQ